jgi:hypothetical protein
MSDLMRQKFLPGKTLSELDVMYRHIVDKSITKIMTPQKGRYDKHVRF